ncbi:MAG: DUF4190 domain-containing protein [Oscillochloridaceae bacterium umkhey_bin13]
MAITSLVAGIISWVMIPVLAAIVAVVTGHIARREIRNAPGRLSGDGMALAGMILGYAQLALIAVGFCFFVFFIMIAAVA